MTITTARQDKEFLDLILGDLFRGFDAVVVLEWVAHNFSPEDVFDETDLNDWAERNNYVKKE